MHACLRACMGWVSRTQMKHFEKMERAQRPSGLSGNAVGLARRCRRMRNRHYFLILYLQLKETTNWSNHTTNVTTGVMKEKRI